MDEMKLSLGSKFMRKMVSKILAKMVYKKTGYKVNINLEELKLNYVDGDTVIKTNVELRMDSKEFKKILNKVDVDEF